MSDKKVYSGRKGTKTSYPTRHRKQASKRPLNRFEAESDTEGVSASAKKLKVYNENFDVDYGFGYNHKFFIGVFCYCSTREV